MAKEELSALYGSRTVNIVLPDALAWALVAPSGQRIITSR
jgi:hypothetical protein